MGSLKKMCERWGDPSRPKVLVKERVDREDIGVDRALMGLQSAGFGKSLTHPGLESRYEKLFWESSQEKK
jgi:hypothetical protein